MSRLRELRLHGFKTFADPTRFAFEPGVNAVIGPNGSGKSNMADAVRWVLGEQSNRSLRTRKSDDVIFAGSQQRKPQGMAEVLLTLDNADGWLPIEFGEVSIGRRAYRSGESEYLINGARARLRDVVALLGEGRLGANELVVVGQGTVDAALSLRPEERRQLFEEAAGVKNLQVRKNEALSRLGRARDNLTRVSDLVTELKPQVRRLALQAQHQQQHDTLLQRARGLVGESHRRRERGARDRLGQARRAAAAADAALEALRDEQRAERAALEAAEQAYWDAERAAREAAARRETTREAVIRSESRLEALSHRRDELGAAVSRGEHDLAETRAALERPLAGDDAALTPLLAASSDAEHAWQAAIAELAEADAALLAAEEALSAAHRERAEQVAAETRRREAVAATNARRERLEREVAASRQALRAAEETASSARVHAEAAAAGRREAEARAEEASVTASQAEQALLAARKELAEAMALGIALRSELAAIEEGAPEDRAESRLAVAGWRRLLDAVDAPQDAWPAVEAVVGGELGEALLWRDADPGALLAEARGTARLLDRAAPDPAGRDEAMRAVGATRTLADWLAAEELPTVFHRTVVAADRDALLRGWRQLPSGWLAVTQAGEMADGRGVVVIRGGAEPLAGSTARRHARGRELAAAAQSAAEAEQRAAALTAATEDAQRRAVDELRNATAAQVDAERDSRAADDALNEAMRQVERHRNEVGSLDAELAAIAQPSADGAAPEATDSDLDAFVAAAADTRRRRDATAIRRDEARAAWSHARDAAQQAEVRSAGQRQERAVLMARLAQLEAGLPRDRESLEQLTADHAALMAMADEARTADAAADRDRTAADHARERARLALVERERTMGASTGRIGDLERAAQTAAIEASRQEEALNALARERELALEGLAETPDEDGAASVQPDSQAQQEDASELAGIADAELEAELRRVRRTLNQIGSVNPFAVEEHAELSTRLADLSVQEADLSEAIGSTETLIGRLDDEINAQFGAAFAAIGRRFDEFCGLLFAGGSGSLQISDGDDGEAPGGIEIVVRPPGKRLQRLAMLSGGERALTGVALLFAMLSVNPVPFCILDEVDAALDEANIGRFADALRKLSEATDFVVITHNRATIEVADTIYGVTMTDAAVSRILSLRLSDVAAEVPA